MIRRLLLAVLACTLVASCTRSSGREVVEATPAGPPRTVVVLGGEESDGSQVDDDLRELWARQAFDQLPLSTTYVNLAAQGASMADVLRAQVPDARALEPTTVLVWSGAADGARGTAPSVYRDDLAALVGAFDEEANVVVLDGPDATYSDVTAEVAAASGATVVDLTDLAGRGQADQEDIAQQVVATLDELAAGG